MGLAQLYCEHPGSGNFLRPIIQSWLSLLLKPCECMLLKIFLNTNE